MKTYLLTLHEASQAFGNTYWNTPELTASAHSIERLVQHARETDVEYVGQKLTTILLPGEQLPPGSQDQSFWEITEVPFLE